MKLSVDLTALKLAAAEMKGLDAYLPEIELVQGIEEDNARSCCAYCANDFNS